MWSERGVVQRANNSKNMAKNTVHTMTRLPINITISKEDLESDDEVLDDGISEKNNTHKKNSIRYVSLLLF